VERRGRECSRRADRDGLDRVGRRLGVLDGAGADLVLVAAATDEGTSLFVVEASGNGIRSTPLETLDMTRRQADLEFDFCEARRWSGYPARPTATCGRPSTPADRARPLSRLGVPGDCSR